MGKIFLTVLVSLSVGFSQVVKSKLNGMTIYVNNGVSGDHQTGFDGFISMLNLNKATYGYNLEYSNLALNRTQLDSVFNRLYKAPGQPKPAKPIDILIFCQGQGDENVAGGPLSAPYPGATVRMAMVRTHVQSGGGFISVHAAHGRDVSSGNWAFGSMLYTDWFVDGYLSADTVTGGENGGHYPSGTRANYTLDNQTLPNMDSSVYFIRKLQTRPKVSLGYGQPLIVTGLGGEWYHFNGGFRYENGQGGAVSNSGNKFKPVQVRGNLGVPDSGIGPSKIIGVLTKITATTTHGSSYIPPGQGRPSVWVREVSPGVFDPKASATNGRFAFFNPGHAPEEWTATNGNFWIRDFFLSTLRWVVKDDRGCTDSTKVNFNALATVNDGTCLPVSILQSAELTADDSKLLGHISMENAAIVVSVEQAGPHSYKVAELDGKVLFQKNGNGIQKYSIPSLKKGIYLVQVEVQGKSFTKSVSL